MRLPLLAIASLFLAADVHGQSTADQLVGHWQYAEKGFISDYVINSDGTFTGHLLYEGKAVWHCSGKWTLSGKTVTTVLTRSSVKELPVGTKDRKTILDVTSEYCRLKNQDGSVWKYLRVP